MEHLSRNLKIKALAEDGSFSGMAAVFNNVDLGGDQIQPGAFTRTLQAGKQFPLLWQHDPNQPIGTVTATETPQGLSVVGQLLLSDPTAQRAYSFLKAGILKGLSIGFETIKESLVDKVRQLKELRLWEVSIVTFPMNLEAGVTAIKAISDADRVRALKSIDAHRKAIDRHQRAIRSELKSMLSDLDDDELEDSLDDPALLEGNDDDSADEEMSKALITEMRSLVAQTREFL